MSNLNTALVEVRTDDGDLVEAHGGYALRAITYDKDKQTYTVACTTAADDTTAQAISQLAAQVEELEVSNTALASQVDYVSMMTDTEVWRKWLTGLTGLRSIMTPVSGPRKWSAMRW